MKHVQENIFEFENAMFFNKLNEEDEKEELSPADKKKKKEELQKKGMAVIQKCIKNFDLFKKFAGDIWQEYRDFWGTQKDADQSVQQEGMFYNLWKSDYIVGVVKEPAGHAALKVFNTSQNDPEEYIAFETKNPDVINAFKDFLEGTVKLTMKDIIEQQRTSMIAKKKADEQRKKEESSAKKQAKLDSFLGESDTRSSGLQSYVDAILAEFEMEGFPIEEVEELISSYEVSDMVKDMYLNRKDPRDAAMELIIFLDLDNV